MYFYKAQLLFLNLLIFYKCYNIFNSTLYYINFEYINNALTKTKLD